MSQTVTKLVRLRRRSLPYLYDHAVPRVAAILSAAISAQRDPLKSRTAFLGRLVRLLSGV